jgi:hypothetical protein
MNSSIGSYVLTALLNTLRVCPKLLEVVAGRRCYRLMKFKPIIYNVISRKALVLN